jgi:peptide/nickel transport system substrate-binding protein
VAVAALQACRGQESAAQNPAAATSVGSEASSGDWLIEGDTVQPPGLNCALYTQRVVQEICRLVADTLIDLDDQLRFVPRLAESFDVSPDGLMITFHLRAGVRWHDGHPFTARDVLHTVEVARLQDPNGGAFTAAYGTLAEVSAPDEHTVKARYASPYAGALMKWRDAFIVPAHIPFDPRQPPSPLDRKPVGTGPFRFVRWDDQTQIILDANEEYFGGRPRVNRFVYRIIPSFDALQAAAEAGTVDFTGLSTDWLSAHPTPDARLPFRVHTFLTTRMEMIYWNNQEPRGLFRDARVRRAMTMLVDREGYTSKIQRGIFRPAVTLIDPLIWGGDPELRPYPFDPNAAARLLDEAGIKDRDSDGIRDTASGPMSFTLLYSSATPGPKELAELFERAAAKAGVRVHLQGLEWSMMKQKLYSQQFEAAIHRFNLGLTPEPYIFFHSSQIGATGFNLGGYRNAQFDRLSEELRRTIDPGQSSRILAQLQRILHEDQPCTAVAVVGAVVAIHKRFRIPEIARAGPWDWYPSLQLWWVPPAERLYH